MLTLTETEIINAIEKSQHCQRNWDLSKTIPEDHINLFIEAVKRAPSKQNIAHYKTHFISDRNLITLIADCTRRHSNNVWLLNKMELTKTINSQALANLLIVFEFYQDYSSPEIYNRNAEAKTVFLNSQLGGPKQIMEADGYTAIGIASGYVALLANMLGYSTGFCGCIQSDNMSKVLNTDNKIMLLLGVGFPNDGVDHVVHHEISTHRYPILSKQEILINRIP